MQEFKVTGLTCGHCVGSVTQALKEVDGVRGVEIDLVAHEISTVKIDSSRELSSDEVSYALREAGNYTLSPAK
jgi:copper chaperone CopZ